MSEFKFAQKPRHEMRRNLPMDGAVLQCVGSLSPSLHRRSQGVQWVHLHPHGGEHFLASFTGKICKSTPSTAVHPQAEQESIFRTFFAVSGRFIA